jgi:hypothetical protein
LAQSLLVRVFERWLLVVLSALKWRDLADQWPEKSNALREGSISEAARLPRLLAGRRRQLRSSFRLAVAIGRGAESSLSLNEKA